MPQTASNFVVEEGAHPGGFIVSEREGYYSRDTINVLLQPGQYVVPGQVLGALVNVALATAVATPVGGDAGDGALTLDAQAPIRTDASDGVYQVEFITGGATAEFNLLDPSGSLVGTGAVGTPFVGPLKFVIADDAAKHYVPGDRIMITVVVPPTAYQCVPLNFGAVDGSQRPAGFAVYGAGCPADAQAPRTVRIAGLMREAEVRDIDVVWPVGATIGQIAEASVQLRARGLILRESVRPLLPQ